MQSSRSTQTPPHSSANWRARVRSSLQLGGKLVFMASSENFQTALQWAAAASKRNLPALAMDPEKVQREQVATKATDLTFFWDADLFKNMSLNKKHQGQRAFMGPLGFDANWMDFHWPDLTFEQWQDFTALESLTDAPAKLFPMSETRPCLFLDRDDVIVQNVPYNSDPDKVVLLPGITELINQAHEKSYWVAMVTNQSGLARHKITWGQYQKVHQRTLQSLAEKGAWIDECQWAAALPDATSEAGLVGLCLRKPRAGLFQLVHEKLGVNSQESIMIGDSASDLIAGYGFGVRYLFLLNSSKLNEQLGKLEEFKKDFPDFKYQVLKTLSALDLNKLH